MKLHPAITAANLADGRVIFRGPFKNVVVTDRSGSLDRLLARLQAHEPLEGTLQEMPAEDRGTAEQILDSLGNRDLLVADGEAKAVDPIGDVLDLAARQIARLSGQAVPTATVRHRAVVLAGGPMVEQAMARFGAEIVPPDRASAGDAALAVLTCDNADIGPHVERIATEKDLPVLFVLVDAYRILWGPVYVPGETASLSDLYYHWGLNALHSMGQHSDLLSLSSAPSPIAMQVALGLAFVRLQAMAAGLGHLVPGGEVVEMDCLTLASRKGQVLRMPRGAQTGLVAHAPTRAAPLE